MNALCRVPQFCVGFAQRVRELTACFENSMRTAWQAQAGYEEGWISNYFPLASPNTPTGLEKDQIARIASITGQSIRSFLSAEEKRSFLWEVVILNAGGDAAAIELFQTIYGQLKNNDLQVEPYDVYREPDGSASAGFEIAFKQRRAADVRLCDALQEVFPANDSEPENDAKEGVTPPSR